MHNTGEKIAELTGNWIFQISNSIGELILLLRRTVWWIFHAKMNRKIVFQQMLEMGNNSFSVTSLTLFFTGMVLGLQIGVSFIKVFNEPLYVGRVVGISIVKELGPVLTAMVFAGRIGAAIAAELGTMKVTEQIDALYTLGTNPVKYLVVPRFVAAGLMLPLLTLYSDCLGILGGYVVSQVRFHIPPTVYWDDILALQIREGVHGLIKSFFFALIVASVACYKGLSTEGGAEGVGKSTTAAVVVSMVLILIGDYFISAILVAVGIA